MAQDETYQTTVYMERGGDRCVAGSGGTIAIESGGSIAVYSGAQMTFESGANLAIAQADLEAEDFRRLVVSEWNETTVIQFSAGLSLLADSNLPKNARIVTIVGSAGASKASFWLTSVSAGREVLLRFVGDLSGLFTNAAASIEVSCSGCILLNSLGGAISGFAFFTSATSDAGVFLKAVADNTWAIISEIGTIVE